MKKNSFRSAMRRFVNLFSRGLRRRKGLAFSIGFVVTVFCISPLFSWVGQEAFAESGNPPKQTPKKTQVQPDVQLLDGRWVRPDGGYVLELGEIKKGGTLKASYFNPRPIKVFSAKWSQKEGKINLFVELRDLNYPGSKYNLQYDPKSDRLRGTYFQAVEKQTFDIEFVRAK